MACNSDSLHPTWNKFSTSSLPGPQGRPGPRGMQGEIGPTGDRGQPDGMVGRVECNKKNLHIVNGTVQLLENKPLGSLPVSDNGSTVSCLVDVLKEMGIVSKIPKKWEQMGNENDIEGTVSGLFIGEEFGYSVSLSADGKTVAVSAPNYSDDEGSDKGRVQVFRYKDETEKWDLLGAQALLVGAAGEQAGSSVSLSADGKTVAVGSPYYDDEGNKNKGRVRVFRYDGDNWGQLGKENDIVGAVGDRAGWSVSLSEDGSTVAVGAPYYRNVGGVRVFSYDGDNWGQLGKDDNIVGAADEAAGYSVSLSADGKTVAVGSPYHKVSGLTSGRVRVFSYDGDNWGQLGKENDIVGAEGDFGWLVSLSADGKTVAVGAPHGGESLSQGRVQVFSYDIISGWTQIGGDLVGAVVDQAGYSVSLSADGKTVAVGAPFYRDGESFKGRVQVFEL